ncbi:MAG: hypothetical protein ACRC30_01725 [Clostridium sp.]
MVGVKGQMKFNDEIISIWKRSIANIAIGFMLNLMTFNFEGIQYILPTVGAGLLFIGFKDLKEFNKKFYRGWICSIINGLIVFMNLIIVVTPLNLKIGNSIIIGVSISIFRIIYIFIFREAIKDFFKTKDIQQKNDPVLKLGVWNIIIMGLSVIQLGTILIIPLFCYYFYIISKIYKIRNILGENYKYIKRNNKKIIGEYIFVNLVIVCICSLFSNHIMLEGEKVILEENKKERNILIDKGIPKEILEAMKDEDIDLLKNVKHVEGNTKKLNFYNDEKQYLDTTTIFIETKEKKKYGIEYFKWNNENAFYRDEITISTTEWIKHISGNLVYEKNGEKYISEMPELESGEFSTTNMNFQVEEVNKVVGAISYPFKSTNHRGYIIYEVKTRPNITLGVSIANYIHYKHPFKIPYTKTGEQKEIFNKNTMQNDANFTTEFGRELHKQEEYGNEKINNN